MTNSGARRANIENSRLPDSDQKVASDVCGSRLSFQRPKVSLCDFYSAQLLGRSQRQQLNCLLFRTDRDC